MSAATRPRPLAPLTVDLENAYARAGVPPTMSTEEISRRLRDLGHIDVPTPRTVTDIVHHHGLIDAAAATAETLWVAVRTRSAQRTLAGGFQGQARAAGRSAQFAVDDAR